MDQHTNFGFSIVAVAPSPALSGTTLEVQPGQGALFPSGAFNCTVWPADVSPIASNAEIIRVTRVGDVFTIVRAQEGTTAKAIAVGYQIANTQTVKVFTDIEDAISVETSARTAKDDVLSTAVSVVSNALSVETAARVSVDTVHAQSLSVLSHAVSVVSQALSLETATRAGAVSVLSLADTVLSVRIDTASALASTADLHAGTASAAATSVNSRVNSVNTFISGISARSAGDVSTHGFQSIINALSNRISAGGGGGGSVTSAEVAAVSAQAASALSDALSMGEVTASEMSLRVNSVNTFLSGVSARSVGDVSTHGLQSVLNALSGRISAASAAVTSVDTRLNTLSDKVVSVSAQLVSIDAHANAASAAATSANSRLNTVSAVSGATSVGGLQSVINQLSNRISGIVAGGGVSVTSTEAQGISAQAASAISVTSAAVTSVNSRVNSVNTFISGISARSVGDVSTHGFQSVIDALSGHISAASAAATSADAHAAAASAAATSVDARLNTLSDKVVSISAQLVSIDAHANAASGAATSVDGRVNSVNTFISGISSRSIGDVSTHGFQSVVNALSNRLSVETSIRGASISVLSNAVTSVDARVNTVSNLVSVLSDRVTSVSAQIVSVDAHANTASAAATSVDGRVTSVNAALSGISARSAGDVSTHGIQSVVNALSNRISAIVAGAASATSNELSAVQASVNGISNFLSGLSTRSGGTSIKGLQSIINSFSNRISAVAGGSVTSNEASAISAQAASALSNAISAGEVTASELSLRIASVNTFISGISSRSVGDVSTHGFQSVVNALSGRIGAASAAVTSVDGRATSLANAISVNLSAVVNASTAGSLAGLSLAIENDASVSAAIINNLSVQQGAGQFKVVTGAQNLSTGVFTKVSGLSLSLGGSNIYKVEGQINYAPNATSGTAVFQLGMSATAQPVYAALRFQGPSAIAAGATQHNTMFGGESAISATPSIMYSVKPGVSGAGHMVFFDGIIQASTVGTQLKVVAATTTTNNGGCTIRVGSYIRAYRIG